MRVNKKQRDGRFVVPILTLCVVMVGCAFSDDERCPDGMQWKPDFNYCVLEEEVEPDGGPEECQVGDAGIDGLGEECTGDGDCAGYTASHCLLNPMVPDDPGICTVSDCVPGSCGLCYQCCDCGAVPIVPWEAPLCLGVSDTGRVVDLGCSCS